MKSLLFISLLLTSLNAFAFSLEFQMIPERPLVNMSDFMIETEQGPKAVRGPWIQSTFVFTNNSVDSIQTISKIIFKVREFSEEEFSYKREVVFKRPIVIRPLSEIETGAIYLTELPEFHTGHQVEMTLIGKYGPSANKDYSLTTEFQTH